MNNKNIDSQESILDNLKWKMSKLAYSMHFIGALV